MKVILAGYNVEAESAAEASRNLGRELTPEVISAAYARISRDPRNVNTLRAEARDHVEKARSSNETIIFGLGHSSVAEHSVFNFDVMGVSRLAVEAVQGFRLASYTEKSQRYIRLGRDHVVPDEISSSRYADEFSDLVKGLSDAYEDVYSKIARSGEKKSVAKEDARYLMPLATSSQFGMTVNARETEYMVSRLRSHGLSEMRELASRISKIAVEEAPSLVRYPEPTAYFLSMDETRRKTAGRVEVSSTRVPLSNPGRVDLVESTPGGDARIAAGIIFSSTRLTFAESLRIARSMKRPELVEVIHGTFDGMKAHDSVWREFENVGMLFEVIVSASCFAQLKRHRMTTQIVQPYDPSLGCTIPDSVRKSGSLTAFRKATARSQAMYRKLLKECGPAAEYALTNAHRRRVLVGINLRELYHFSRLRSDVHAQWEIREISGMMCAAARKRYPVSAAMLAGKDGFEDALRKLQA